MGMYMSQAGTYIRRLQDWSCDSFDYFGIKPIETNPLTCIMY